VVNSTPAWRTVRPFRNRPMIPEKKAMLLLASSFGSLSGRKGTQTSGA
jgi:hypothetical protein